MDLSRSLLRQRDIPSRGTQRTANLPVPDCAWELAEQLAGPDVLPDVPGHVRAGAMMRVRTDAHRLAVVLVRTDAEHLVTRDARTLAAITAAARVSRVAVVPVQDKRDKTGRKERKKE